MKFSDLGLSDEVLKAVADAGYVEPTPIQEQAIPYVFMGRDILGCAQTGTGKTASFTLPMIDILARGRAKARMPRSLILEPTRELAAQVAKNFETYGKYHKLSMALLIGGASLEQQARKLDRGVDVLIATPGRLLDLFGRGQLLLNDVKILVIDESDRMLDMGFMPDVERIVSLLPKIRQTLLFSATMPPEIRRLANVFLMNPKEISVAPPATTAETVSQGLVIVVPEDTRRPGSAQKAKRAALRALIAQEDVKNALVFCNRKRDVDILCRSLKRHGFNADRLHGDMPQPARTETLDRFRAGEITFLVCSDVAARGLDIKGMSHVFNFDVPTNAEDYVHRIGRTARAGLPGRALTIALPEDAKYIDAIERLTGEKIQRITVEGQPAGQLQEAGEGERRRPSRRGRGRGRERTRESEPATPAERPGREPRGERPRREARAERPSREKREASREPRAERPSREPRAERPGREKREGAAPVGMGDHVPAFMLRPAKAAKPTKPAKPAKPKKRTGKK